MLNVSIIAIASITSMRFEPPPVVAFDHAELVKSAKESIQVDFDQQMDQMMKEYEVIIEKDIQSASFILTAKKISIEKPTATSTSE